jgi:catechol 2,3-dioxygenase-like lactoylglutathione lyase family enzyme
MIHHVSLGTSDVERARRFYDPVMELLGLRMLECADNGVHYGTGHTFFSLV